MLIAISGTPGTGKSSVSALLQRTGYRVVSLNDIAVEKGFVVGVDKKRDSRIVDVDSLNSYIQENFETKEAVFIEGLASHLLKTVDKVILLRCHPKVLIKRLKDKKWNEMKIKENVEAETIDVILCETVEVHPDKNVFEIDTTYKKIDDVFSSIVEIIKNGFKPIKKYNIGQIDWSEEILKEL